jgi:hypothetical protein
VRELLGRALAALKSLKPQLQNEGAGSVQVGKAGGSVKVVNINQAAPLPSGGDGNLQVGQVQGSVTHTRVVQQVVHQHFYAAAPPPASVERTAVAPPPASAPPQQPAKQRTAQHLSPLHKEVLTLMEPLPKKVRVGVLEFMRREFGTAMVKELLPQEVYRVKLYVQQVIANRKREAATHEFL